MRHIIDIPPPPLILSLAEGELYDKDVIVKLMDGGRKAGKLKEINGPLQKIVIQSPAGAQNLDFLFRNVRYILFSPVKDLNDMAEAEITGLDRLRNARHKQKIIIKYKDGVTAEGFVLGYIADTYGLHLFREIKAIRTFRIFIPAATISKYQIGDLLGEIITEHNIIDKMTLKKLLKEQSNRTVNKTGIADKSAPATVPRLGEILQNRGKISDETLHRSIAKKFGLPYVDLHNFSVDPLLIDLIPANIARKYMMAPINKQKNHLTIAMDDPGNIEAIQMVQFITGMDTEIVVSSRNNIENALNALYDPLQNTNIKYTDNEDELPAGVDARKLGEQKPIVKLTNNILSEAIRRRTSDIHIRPSENYFTLLFRIDGTLVKIRDFDKDLLPGIISRIKILGNMDISERRVPQDGRTRVINEGSVVDLRISIIPTVSGESAVIRLLNTKVGIKTLANLDFNKHDFTLFKDTLNKMHGLILVTGPTGSGKSTTLYAALNEVIGRNLNIITVEDPVEYHIEDIEQVQVNNATGLTFARILRNILRHDPDVIMIGEIRDEETARIAIQSSLTGHLVLSTLHTNSAVGAITRLKDMNIEPYLIAPTLLCILAQRLIRCICPECSETDNVPDHIVKELGLNRNEKFYYGKGCDKCNNTGYSGRLAVYELLMVNQRLREAIKKMETESVMHKIAKESGMISLVDNALARAREGRISITEVYRLSQDN